jgi:pimeloyl-ACP methyl ester carboxylesterase
MKTFILIHGAWLNAGIWERIAPLLRQAGHEVITPELPGNGRDTTPASEVSLQTYVDAVGALISAHKEVVLVGHSMAGIIVSSVAEAMPKNIAHLIYLAAFMLPDGASVVSFQEGQRALRTGQQQIARGAGGFLSFSEDKSFSTLNPELVPEKLCNTCTQSDAQLVVRHLAPQPSGPRRDPVHVTESGWGSVPRTYIKTLQDKAVSTELQDAMIVQLPGTAVIELDSDHSPFYSDSEKLVQILLNIV